MAKLKFCPNNFFFCGFFFWKLLFPNCQILYLLAFMANSAMYVWLSAHLAKMSIRIKCPFRLYSVKKNCKNLNLFDFMANSAIYVWLSAYSAKRPIRIKGLFRLNDHSDKKLYYAFDQNNNGLWPNELFCVTGYINPWPTKSKQGLFKVTYCLYIFNLSNIFM